MAECERCYGDGWVEVLGERCSKAGPCPVCHGGAEPPVVAHTFDDYLAHCRERAPLRK